MNDINKLQLDIWDVDDIERNVVDYLTTSTVNTDAVIVINSIGAYYRYRCKAKKESRIERKQPGHLDEIFEKQIDYALT